MDMAVMGTAITGATALTVGMAGLTAGTAACTTAALMAGTEAGTTVALGTAVRGTVAAGMVEEFRSGKSPNWKPIVI